MTDDSPSIQLIAAPEILREIPDPPKQVYQQGAPLERLLLKPCLAVVGTRHITPYGQRITTDIVRKVAERGVVIISGLALGVDAVAHEAALSTGGITIAVLPGPIENVLPTSNRYLSRKILQRGGALISEYSPQSPGNKYNFVARNRLVSGLADAVLITEAGDPSGSLRTADFALDQGKTILAVPGNITSPVSTGTNKLLKQGAIPVTSYVDVLDTLNIQEEARASPSIKGNNKAEQTVIDLLAGGVQRADQLLQVSGLSAAIFNQTITMLEIRGIVRSFGNSSWALC